jgi:hypothetical protein
MNGFYPVKPSLLQTGPNLSAVPFKVCKLLILLDLSRFKGISGTSLFF